MGEKLLIVDDDQNIRTSLKDYFERQGFDVTIAEDGKAALDILSKVKPYLIILDYALPGMNGLDVCQAIREQVGYTVYIIMISGVRNEEFDLQAGLQFGADYYIFKPFETSTLLAQIKAFLRRPPVGRTDIAETGWFAVDKRLRINVEQRQIEVDGQDIHLAPKDFDLLKYLFERRGIPCTRTEIIDAVWPEHEKEGFTDGALNTRISEIRRAIEPDPDHPCYIRTIYRVGYRFAVP